MKKVYTLTQGRHDIVNVDTGELINKSIYGKTLSINISGLEDFADEFIKREGVGDYEIYVTGFTPALTSFIKIAIQGQEVRHLVLWHYDSVADTYRKQIMW